jgi:hypothetical protein
MRRKIEVFLRQTYIEFLTSFNSLDTFFSSLLPPYQFFIFATEDTEVTEFLKSLLFLHG